MVETGSSRPTTRRKQRRQHFARKREKVRGGSSLSASQGWFLSSEPPWWFWGRSLRRAHRRLQLRYDGRPDAEPRQARQGRFAVHRLLCRGELYGARANFIMGELPIRTGMTKVGQAGAPIGRSRRLRSDRDAHRQRPVQSPRNFLPWRVHDWRGTHRRL
jgi:hypothetical protein